MHGAVKARRSAASRITACGAEASRRAVHVVCCDCTIPLMPIYRVGSDKIEALPHTSFSARGITERADLQRLLRANIGVVTNPTKPDEPGVLVIGEEFAEWEDSKRRIDLLGVDDKANLVVIELKRDDEGGHMELQAIRYAAMVSGMTFAKAAEVFQAYLDRRAAGENARARLLEFLGWEEPREDDFASDVRIVLVAADFGKEVTTAVLWLNTRDIDVRCVRLKPYAIGEQTIVDAQQVVPLPEAEDYIIQIKQKEQAERSEKAARHSERRMFWTAALPIVSAAVPRWKNISAGDDGWLNAAAGRPGLAFQLWTYTDQCGSSLYIDGGTSRPAWAKAVYDRLHEVRPSIEASFGGPLNWNRLDDKRASIIATQSIQTGYRSPRQDWPQAHSALAQEMRRFESVLTPHIDAVIASIAASR